MFEHQAMKKRILIVDDDKDILEALTTMLSMWNYDARGISRGEDVFGEAADFRPDLILMDVMLSGMDGRSIVKALKTIPFLAGIPVIMISAHMSMYSAVFDENGPDDFVPKPFDMNYLQGKIERQLAA